MEEMSIADLPEQYRDIAEAIGIAAYRLLVLHFGGTQLYVPQTREILREYKYRLIKAEFDGGNAAELAMRYGLSDRTVYRLIQEKIKDARRTPAEGQISFADFGIT